MKIKRRCKCGCGNVTSCGKKYILGHHARCMSKEHRRKISDAGKERFKSKKERKKISLSLIGNKNSLGYRHTKDTRKKMSEKRRGEKHPNWKGGYSKTAERKSHYMMLQRCYNPDSVNYKHYGGRGIRVCIRWRRSFKAFLRDMGERPASDLSIDRIDNDGNYTPDNCRWATRKEQSFNKVNTILLSYNRKTKTLKEWSKETGINYNTLRSRYHRGFTPEKILKV